MEVSNTVLGNIWKVKESNPQWLDIAHIGKIGSQIWSTNADFPRKVGTLNPDTPIYSYYAVCVHFFKVKSGYTAILYYINKYKLR